jgi:hypothetical protein
MHRSGNSRMRAATYLACSLALAPWSSAHADEGGVAFWMSGQFASLSAVPPTPGASVTLIPYYYNGSGNASKTFQRGDTLVSGVSAQVPLLLVQHGEKVKIAAIDPDSA